MLDGIVFGSITYFYNVKLGLDENLVGIVWLIFMFWNALNDPLFGILQEKTQTKIGRRIPYFRFGSVFYGLFFILSWIPVFGTSKWGLFFSFLLSLFLFDTIFTLVGLVSYSLPAEMAMDPQNRAQLSVYTTIFGAIGVLISMVIPMFLLVADDANTALNPAFYPTMIILGIISSVMMFVSSFFLKENNYTLQEETLGFFEGFRVTFNNKPFLIFEVVNFFYVICYTILTSAIFYYIDFVLELTGFQAFIPLIVLFSTLFIFSAISSRFVHKLGLKRLQTYSLYFAGVAFVISFFFADKLIPAIFCFILLSIGIAGRTITEQPIISDIIDYDEILTGKRRETTYSGMNAVFTKPSQSIGNWLYLFVFGLYGFNDELATQSEYTQKGMMVAIMLIPGIMLLFCGIFMRFYNLDGEKWNQQKKEIASIHRKKEQAYLKTLEKPPYLPQ